MIKMEMTLFSVRSPTIYTHCFFHVMRVVAKGGIFKVTYPFWSCISMHPRICTASGYPFCRCKSCFLVFYSKDLSKKMRNYSCSLTEVVMKLPADQITRISKVWCYRVGEMIKRGCLDNGMSKRCEMPLMRKSLFQMMRVPEKSCVEKKICTYTTLESIENSDSIIDDGYRIGLYYTDLLIFHVIHHLRLTHDIRLSDIKS